MVRPAGGNPFAVEVATVSLADSYNRFIASQGSTVLAGLISPVEDSLLDEKNVDVPSYEKGRERAREFLRESVESGRLKEVEPAGVLFRARAYAAAQLAARVAVALRRGGVTEDPYVVSGTFAEYSERVGEAVEFYALSYRVSEPTAGGAAAYVFATDAVTTAGIRFGEQFPDRL